MLLQVHRVGVASRNEVAGLGGPKRKSLFDAWASFGLAANHKFLVRGQVGALGQFEFLVDERKPTLDMARLRKCLLLASG